MPTSTSAARPAGPATSSPMPAPPASRKNRSITKGLTGENTRSSFSSPGLRRDPPGGLAVRHPGWRVSTAQPATTAAGTTGATAYRLVSAAVRPAAPDPPDPQGPPARPGPQARPAPPAARAPRPVRDLHRRRSCRPGSAPCRCRSLCSAGKITDVTALQLTDDGRQVDPDQQPGGPAAPQRGPRGPVGERADGQRRHGHQRRLPHLTPGSHRCSEPLSPAGRRGPRPEGPHLSLHGDGHQPDGAGRTPRPGRARQRRCARQPPPPSSNASFRDWTKRFSLYRPDSEASRLARGEMTLPGRLGRACGTATRRRRNGGCGRRARSPRNGRTACWTFPGSSRATRSARPGAVAPGAGAGATGA